MVFTSPLTSRLCSQLQELQELPNLPLRMWSSSKKHQLLLTWASGPGVEPGSRGHKANALPLSYPHTLNHPLICKSSLDSRIILDLRIFLRKKIMTFFSQFLQKIATRFESRIIDSDLRKVLVISCGKKIFHFFLARWTSLLPVLLPVDAILATM